MQKTWTMWPGVAFAAFSAVAFSINTPLAPWVYSAGGTALMIVFCRAVGAVVLSALILPFVQHREPLTKGFAVSQLLAVLLFAQGVLYVGSVAYIPVSLSALLFYTWPVLVGLLSVVGLAQYQSKRTLCYFFVALLGLGIALQADFSVLDQRGVMLALLGAVSMASYLVLTARLPSRETSPVVFNLQLNLGVTMLAGLAFLVVPFALPQSLQGIVALLAIAVFYTIALFAQIIAVRWAGASMSALFFNIEPIASIVLAVVLLDESFGRQKIVGATLVIVTLTLFAVHHLKKPT